MEFDLLGFFSVLAKYLIFIDPERKSLTKNKNDSYLNLTALIGILIGPLQRSLQFINFFFWFRRVILDLFQF